MPWSSSRSRSSSYGAAHAKARKQWAAAHDPSDPCTRCRRPLGPMSSALHLDHNRDRTGYLGFAHARCNVTAGAREGRARQDASRLRW